MRVIAGSAKGARLVSVPGKTTRPITDQVKEALFNILGPSIIDRTVLDLFGGTGAVGIEALSRGAEHAVLIEINYKAFKTIQQNLKTTKLDPYATVLKKDAFTYLKEEQKSTFDLIYIAPPQYEGLWLKAMRALDQNPSLIKLWERVIVQIHPKEFDEKVEFMNFKSYDLRDYGDTLLVFYERVSPQ
jgi:16S rRNA (guanine966-N2)-methyltransferase